MTLLAGKAALVFGAGSSGPGFGNGKAASILLAREGARVLCADSDADAARETADVIRAEGGEAVAVCCDVTRAEEIGDAVAACLDHFGRIDVLDNNVGIVETGGVVELSEETWDRVLAVNLKSCFLTMKQVIPVMQRQGGGSIVNVSSVAAIRHTGVPYAAYYASKAAMSHLTRTTAVEYAAQQIRINAVLPGLMRTPLVERSTGLADAFGGVEEMWQARAARVPMGRMGDAWDVANAVLFLASDMASYVTGIELVVDGGLTQSST
ncbi:MAG TPA: glucose 1-dehydrogenase [Gaiellaceae bacterium]|nr:glucose 1-dehydrogenase [Gaiellaceae bacterium]